MLAAFIEPSASPAPTRLWTSSMKRMTLPAFFRSIVSELIGKHSFSFGPVGFTLFPMLYALIIGIILAQFKLIDREMMTTASPYITISVMYLTAKMASSIGPNLEAVLNAGPALIDRPAPQQQVMRHRHPSRPCIRLRQRRGNPAGV